MALRNNVWEVRDQLWSELTPLQMQVIDIIIDKTIKWRTKEARIKIQEFMERTRQADTHIYAALRELKRKKIIIWNKDRMGSVIGLNEEYFGGLLIKRHEEALLERRKKIHMVVDNSRKSVDNSKVTDGTGQSERRQASVKVTEGVSQNDGNRQSEHNQELEIVKERRSLKTLLKDIPLKTSLKESADAPSEGNKESFTLSGEQGTEAEIVERGKRRLRKQVAQLSIASEKKQA